MFVDFVKVFFSLIIFLPALVFGQSVSTEINGVYNGFLDQINVLECENRGDSGAEVRIELREYSGEVAVSQVVSIPEKGARHLILNDLFNISDTYGTWSVSSLASVECRTAFYRSDADGSAYDYAYTLPSLLPVRGLTSGGFNSQNPSLGGDSTPNWISVVNLSGSRFEADLYLYNAGGDIIKHQFVTLENRLERLDISAGHEYGQLSGSYSLVPRNLDSPYAIWLTRYGLAKDSSFTHVVPLAGKNPGCQPRILPLSTVGLSASNGWLEVTNPSAMTLKADISIHNMAGNITSRQYLELEPRGTHHFDLVLLLGADSTGSAHLSCQAADGALEAVSMTYGLDSSMNLKWAHGSSGTVDFDLREYQLPLNTFLAMSNRLRLVAGHRSTTVDYNVNDLAGNTIHSGRILLGSFESSEIEVRELLGVDTYGSLEISSMEPVHIDLLKHIPLGKQVYFTVPVSSQTSSTTDGSPVTTTTTSSTTTTTIPISIIGQPAKAFPTAFGHGAFRRDWQGARVVFVDKLTDSNPAQPGELRHAINNISGPRIVLFRVSGAIELNSTLFVRSEDRDLYLAGQSAPGDGISLQRSSGFLGNDMIRLFRTDNIIFRYLRIRGGRGVPGSGDGISNIASSNIVYDHISVAWGNDENLGFWTYKNEDMINVSVQNCLIAEPMAGHSTNMLIGGELDFNHNHAANQPCNGADVVYRVRNFSLHRNVFSHASHRNPMISARNAIISNNLSYNWQEYNMGHRGASEVDYLNNFMIEGPSSVRAGVKYRYFVRQGMLLNPSAMPDNRYSFSDPNSHFLAEGSVHISGNFLKRYQSSTTDGLFQEWATMVERVGLFDPAGPLGPSVNSDYQCDGSDFRCLSNSRRSSPIADNSANPYPLERADAAMAEQLLAEAGASRGLDCAGNWVSKRDSLDSRLVAEISTQTASAQPNSAADAGGYPILESAAPCPDSDLDGIPDRFEDLFGLDRIRADAFEDLDQDGYTNLEEYLNGTDPRI